MIEARNGPWLSPSRRLSDAEVPELLRQRKWRIGLFQAGFGPKVWRITDGGGMLVASGRTRQIAIRRALGIAPHSETEEWAK